MPPPADRLAETGHQICKDQIHLTPQTAMVVRAAEYAALRRSTIVKARQALAYAVDLKSLVNFFGGRNACRPDHARSCRPGFPGL